MDSNMIAPTSQQDAMAVEIFERFCGASTMKQILNLYREICNVIKIKPSVISEFYPSLKSRLIKSWKAQAIFRKLDMKYNSKIYNQGKVCPNTRVLIIGAGPCGMRAAIDAQLLGAKVVVIEKRDRMSRNNVLHLWPFVIEDLRNIGAKKFLGKFCAGSIDHISIRQLQHILLKVALLLGVEFHEGVSFENLIEPLENEKNGWKVSVTPVDHPVSHYEFDVLIGADGKRNTLPGFKRKEFRGRLAIAITANFINRHSKEEASVQEISGTAFIFNQQFFKDLKKEFSIDLENIVYYKDDTHYFVMTAKKQSLIERNVLLQDYPETAKLLSRENINYPALRAYALDAAGYSTDFGLPDLEFAVNHYGQPDVAVFDFTSMFAAENASKVLERNNHKLLVCLVGDSLLEPFWPTGSGCARGFLSSLDACWAIRSWGMGLHPLAVLAERESIYRILAQTTPQNLNPDLVHYTVDPTTRYLALNKAAVGIHQILYLYNSDNPNVFKNVDQIELVPQIPTKKRKRETLVHHDTLLSWFKKQLVLFNTIKVENLTTSFKDGLVLCAVLHIYRPDLIDFSVIDFTNPVQNNEIAFQLLKQLGISPVMTAQEMVNSDVPNITTMVMYLSQIYQNFKGEIPVMKHKKMESPEPEKTRHSSKSSAILDPATVISNNAGAGTGRNTLDSESRRKNRKHRTSSHTGSSKYVGTPVELRRKMFEEEPEESLDDEEKYNRRLLRILFIRQQHLKSVHMLHTNSKDNVPGFSSLEDSDLISYRQNTINMDDRIKNLEKLMNPEVRDKSSGNLGKSTLNDDFSKKVKNMEDQFRVNAATSNKKPKDLMRAIGKIETTDWNYREIEKKIHENRMGRPSPHEKEKVPRWNREQFLARQTRIVEHGAERVDTGDGKFHDIDSSLKQLDRQLKEGNVLERGERGKNKVASLAGQFTKKNDDEEVAKNQSTHTPKVPLKMNIGKKAEMCHLCKTEVYLVERISPEEGLILHKSCFKCHHCFAPLKIGSYSFDRDGRYQNNVFCPHHFGFLGKTVQQTKNIVNPVNIVPVLASNVYAHTSPVNESIPDFNYFDRDQTPERIEIESQIDTEEEYNEMDEDEWTDKNFGTSVAIDDTSDAEDEDSSSGDEDGSKREKMESCSDSEGSDDDDDDDDDDDSDDYSSESSEQFSCRDSSGDEEGASGTWGSEQQMALDKRRQEVALGPLPPSTSPTDTEVASESSSKNSEAANSATEVSTDSEFAHDDPTPTCEVPVILCNDRKIKQNERNWEAAIEKKKAAKNENLKTNVNNFAKVQVTSRIIANGNLEKKNKPEEHIKLELKSPIAPAKAPLVVPRLGDYLLSRTQSTSGIATKRALELKKNYLLGPQAMIGLQKSDSASELDSKLRAFHRNISECQRMLNATPDVPPTLQTFLDNSPRSNAWGLLSPTNMNKLPAIAVESIPTISPTSPSYLYSNMTNYPFTKTNNNEVNSDNSKKVIENNMDNPPASVPDVVQTAINSNILNKEILVMNVNLNMKKSPKEPAVSTEENIPVKPINSPIFETSIVVPKIPWKDIKKNEYPSGTDIDSDSLHSFNSSSDDVSGKHNTQSNISVPRVEIMKPCGEIMQLDSLMVVNGEYIGPQDSDDDITVAKVTTPKQGSENPFKKPEKPSSLIDPVAFSEGKNNQAQAFSSSDSGNDITAFFTDNEPLDWAVEGTAADSVGLKQPHGRTTHSQNHDTAWKAFALDNFDESEHVCGKHVDKDVKKISNILDCDHSDIDFMDTGSEESLIENQDNVNIRESINTGFIEFVDVCVSNQRDVLPKSTLIEAVNRHCDSPVNDRSINFIEQGACILNNDQFSSEYGNSLCENENPSKTQSVASLEEKDSVEYKCEQEEDGFLIINAENDNFETKPNEDANHSSLCEAELNSVDDNNSSNHNSISTNTNEFVSHHNSNSTTSGFETMIAPHETKDTPKKICNSPGTTRKLEEISKEKVKQKDLIHQLVMDKMSKISEKRSDRRSRSPIIVQQFTHKSNKVESSENIDFQKVPLSKIEDPVQKIHKHVDNHKKESAKNISHPKHSISLKIKPLNDCETYTKTKHPNNSETFSLPDIHQSVMEENKLDKLRKLEDCKVPKKRILSEDSSLDYSHFSQPGGIVPGFRKLSLNDFSGKLVQHVESLRNSSPNHDTYQSLNPSSSLCTSDPNFLISENTSKKIKGRDTERRKSIIKTVSDFFSRRRDGHAHSSLDEKKNKSPPGQKFKNKSNSCYNLDRSESLDAEMQKIPHFDINNEVPPPIPPLPMNYCTVQSTSGYLDGNTSLQQSPPLCLPVTKKITAKKRCNSLNEIQNKINETEKCLEKIEDMRTQAWNKLHSKTGGGEERVLLQDCLSLNKYYENLVKQRNSQTTRAHELLLEERQQQLRLKLRDVLNGGKDTNHTQENAIINEMMAIVAERQNLSSSRRLND